jgi:exosortase
MSLAEQPALAARSGAAVESSACLGLSLETGAKIAILAPLFVALYWLVLRWLWDKTNPIWGEANWGHAICIPVIGLYYLYVNREEIEKQPVEPLLFGSITARHRLIPGLVMLAIGSAGYLLGNDASGYIHAAGGAIGLLGLLVLLLDWGLGSVICGLAIFAYGIWPGQNQFLQGCAMILTLFGVVLMVWGWKIMRYAWFPIAYLVCGIPWPPLVYSMIASPLQTLAAKAAVVTLRITGVTAYRTGTKINYIAHGAAGIGDQVRTLNVAEACAGLRSLMTFITVGAAVAFLSARPLWQKLIIVVSAIPIAIFCNVMRISGQGLLDNYVSQQLSESFAHQFVGLVMLVPAFFMILGVGWVLDHLFIEEADDGTAVKKTTPTVIEAPRRNAPVKTQAPVSAKTQAPASAKTQAPVSAKIQAPASAKTQAPASAKTQAASGAKPQGGAGAKSQTSAPAKRQAPAPAKRQATGTSSGAGVTPPRPGIVPPRPNIVPPRPAPARPQANQPAPAPPSRPAQPRKRPQTPEEGQS